MSRLWVVCRDCGNTTKTNRTRTLRCLRCHTNWYRRQYFARVVMTDPAKRAAHRESSRVAQRCYQKRKRALAETQTLSITYRPTGISESNP